MGKLSILWLFVLLVFPIHLVIAQETAYLELPYTPGTTIDLNLEECFSIQIRTQKDLNHVVLKSKSEGVYQNQMRLDYHEAKGGLYVFTAFPPILSSGFDKLSSHKVLVFEVEIILPEGVTLHLKSNVGFVEVEGSFDFFQAELKYGDIDLTNFLGNANIATYRGHINLATQDASIEAESRKGQVEITEFAYQKHHILLKSIEGDIKVVNFD